jgi:hypothetical protein
MEKINNTKIKSFMESYVNSLISWAIIVFYQQNPGVRDRVTDLARHLGRNEADVARAVEHLRATGFLRVDVGEETVYYYEPDDTLSEQVNVFVNAMDARDTRLWLLSEILDK